MNPFGHTDIRVINLDETVRFYNTFLPQLGFTVRDTITGPEETWETFALEGYPNAPFVSFVADKHHTPNQNCIAFRVTLKQDVDKLSKLIIAAGATEVEGPEPLAPDCPNYYALFFRDPSGNRLEIYHWEE